MKRSYWEQMASTYGEDIFDVLANDEKAHIRSAIEKFASPDKTVIDIGCAIGKWLPVLSPLFRKVIALDISAKNLAIAKDLHPHLRNVQYVRADMSGKNRFRAADVGICINAILTPDRKARDNFFASLSRCIRKGGSLILTVPSLESWLLSSIVQQQYKVDARLFPKTTNTREALKKWNNIRQGNADIDEVPHKHYLKEELQLLLANAGFEFDYAEKIEYNWTTEFLKPPSWLTEPRPWDWMVVARRNA